MDAITKNVGSALGVKPKPTTLVGQIQAMLKELFEEILLYIGKFKAWLTPGTADDEVRVTFPLLGAGRRVLNGRTART